VQNVKICINGTVTNEVLQEQDVSENGTETELEQPEQTPAEGTQEVPASDINNVSEDFYTEILVAQQSGNEILGKMYAMQIFLLVLLFAVLMYLIIKNNFTKLF
jgi:hypothetical protein